MLGNALFLFALRTFTVHLIGGRALSFDFLAPGTRDDVTFHVGCRRLIV